MLLLCGKLCNFFNFPLFQHHHTHTFPLLYPSYMYSTHTHTHNWSEMVLNNFSPARAEEAGVHAYLPDIHEAYCCILVTLRQRGIVCTSRLEKKQRENALARILLFLDHHQLHRRPPHHCLCPPRATQPRSQSRRSGG